MVNWIHTYFGTVRINTNLLKNKREPLVLAISFFQCSQHRGFPSAHLVHPMVFLDQYLFGYLYIAKTNTRYCQDICHFILMLLVNKIHGA